MRSAESALVTVVTTRGCHLCDDAVQALAALGRVYPLTVEEVAAHSPAGQALVLEHGTGIFPLVLVGEMFFSAGRLPRRRLARLLAKAPAAVAVAR